MKNLDNFNIENKYIHYLKKIGLNNDNMGPIQQIQTKRAFYAGMASMFDLFLNDIGTLMNEKKACDYIDLVQEQLLDYFKHEINK